MNYDWQGDDLLASLAIGDNRHIVFCASDIRRTATGPHCHLRIQLDQTVLAWGLVNVARDEERGRLLRSALKHLNNASPDVDEVKHNLDLFCLGMWAQYMEHQSAPVRAIVGDVEDFPIRVDYLVKPLLIEGQPTIIFGKGGLGKGWCAILLSLLAAEGLSMLGLEPRSPTNVLYLDWEANEQEFNRRLSLLKAGGLGSPDTSILYRRCTHSLADDLESIQEAVAGVKAGLVVVDSLLGACGGEDLEKSQTAAGFYNAWRHLNCTGMLLAHTQKGGTDKTVFGSAFWENQSRAVWSLVSVSEPGSQELLIGLTQAKVNIGRKHKPLAFRLTFSGPTDLEDDTVTVEVADPKSIPAIAEKEPLWLRIVSLLQQERMLSPKAIADNLSVPPSSVTAELSRRKDVFNRLPGFKPVYGLLSEREEGQ